MLNEKEEDDSISLGVDPLFDDSGSHSVVSDSNSLALDSGSVINLPVTLDRNKLVTIVKLKSSHNVE